MNVEKKGYVTRMGVSKFSCSSSSDGLKLFDGIQAEQVWVFDFRVVNLKCLKKTTTVTIKPQTYKIRILKHTPRSDMRVSLIF